MRALVHCLDRLGVDSTFVSSFCPIEASSPELIREDNTRIKRELRLFFLFLLL